MGQASRAKKIRRRDRMGIGHVQKQGRKLAQDLTAARARLLTDAALRDRMAREIAVLQLRATRAERAVERMRPWARRGRRGWMERAWLRVRGWIRRATR